jgi:small subunit ribosomal protein S6
VNAYELTFIIRPDLDEDGTRAVVEQVTGRISSVGGELIAALSWNPPRRRLAYPIKDFGDGYYVTTVFRLGTDELRPLENALKLNDRILRYLLVQATEQNIKQAQQRLAQQAAAAARPPAPEPAAAPPPVAQAAAPPPAMPAVSTTVTPLASPPPVATAVETVPAAENPAPETPEPVTQE